MSGALGYDYEIPLYDDSKQKEFKNMGYKEAPDAFRKYTPEEEKRP